MLKFTTQNTRQSQCIVGTVYFSKSRNNAIPNIAIHDIPTSFFPVFMCVFIYSCV